ncbi:hypothetical protein [Maricaulis sp.]|uniref:hypothetical protein n=1 Tax=Maricaulis sp. TaxID=1486257 RepID=UPI002B2705C0|nr:hypothetical protein [Maricaulis sp.]
MRILFALLLSLLLSPVLSAPVLAAASPPAESEGGSGEGGRSNRILTLFNLAGSEDEDEAEEDDSDDPRAFTMPTVVAPLSRDGRLTGYAYVQLRVRVADGQNIWDVREAAHYALDAAVRACYRNSVSNDEGTDLDPERAVRVWEAALREHYGQRAIDHVEIRQADTRIFRR